MTNIESIRRSKGLSQTYIANKLGISRFWYWLIEKNKVNPSKEIEKELENFFKKPISYLLKITKKEG